jgi:hypothetical protein
MTTFINSPANDMLTELDVRLEHSEEFTPELRLIALNNGQKSVVKAIHDAYLTELEVIEDGTATDGILRLSDLSNPVMGGNAGIKAIKHRASKKFATRLEFSDIKIFDNSMIDVDPSEPYFIVFADRIEIVPQQEGQPTLELEVYYAREPYALEEGGECMLNAVLYPLIVGMAETFCWNNSEEYARAESASEQTIAEINILNQKYQES